MTEIFSIIFIIVFKFSNFISGDIKLVQVCTLLAEINKFVMKHSEKKPSVIICGDFNSTQNSLLYKFITQTKLNFKSSFSFNYQCK